MSRAYRAFFLAASVLAAGTGGVNAQTVPDQLMARSREASTAREHATLAREFRQQAERFEAEAIRQEALSAQMGRNVPAIAQKWPAMVPKALTHARDRAMDARRAARESRDLSDRHLRQAVEEQLAAR